MKSQIPSDSKALDDFVQNYLKQTISALEVSALQKTKVLSQGLEEKVQEKIDEEIGKQLSEQIEKQQNQLSLSYYHLVHSFYYGGIVAEMMNK